MENVNGNNFDVFSSNHEPYWIASANKTNYPKLEDDITVVGTASDGLEAIKMCSELKPDVILMDIRMPNLNGVESTKEILKSCPSAKIVILTTFDDEEYIIDALAHGAVGYLLKDIDGDKLIQEVRDAANGDTLISSKVAAKIAAKLSQLTLCTTSQKLEEDTLSHDYIDFSGRELEIAKLIVNGLNNKQIASTLYITEGTVKNYISSIYSKIDMNDRTKASIFLKNYLKII
jgi:DNA-binding NarL/FixJ family response regulator